MKKFLVLALMSVSALIHAQQVQLNGGYPFKHNGTTCFFYPTNGIPTKVCKGKEGFKGCPVGEGFVRCFTINHYPATVKRISPKGKKKEKDSFSVKYATADKGKQKAQYKIEFSS